MTFGIFGTVVEAAVAYTRSKEAASKKMATSETAEAMAAAAAAAAKAGQEASKGGGGCRRIELDERLLGET